MIRAVEEQVFTQTVYLFGAKGKGKRCQLAICYSATRCGTGKGAPLNKD
jgi:hypothetical protein